jgi:hypothetical protein
VVDAHDEAWIAARVRLVGTKAALEVFIIDLTELPSPN